MVNVILSSFFSWQTFFLHKFLKTSGVVPCHPNQPTSGGSSRERTWDPQPDTGPPATLGSPIIRGSRNLKPMRVGPKMVRLRPAIFSMLNFGFCTHFLGNVFFCVATTSPQKRPDWMIFLQFFGGTQKFKQKSLNTHQLQPFFFLSAIFKKKPL